MELLSVLFIPNNLPYYILISLIGVSILTVIFRPKFLPIPLILGVIAFFIALIIEGIETTQSDLLFMIIIGAPVLEEILKFIMTAHGKDIRTGITVGFGFALLENAYYFSAYSSILLTIFLIRFLSDPILHGTTTSVATLGWKKYRYVLIAIAMHSLWNVLAVFSAYNNSYIPMILITIVYGIILTYMRYFRGKKEEVRKTDMEASNVHIQ